MRLGLLGPVGARPASFQTAVRFLLEQENVDRAVYLGFDGALDRVVERRAQELVGKDASDDGLIVRSAKRCVEATAEEIDAFVAAERERTRLKIFESLAGDDTRAVELLDGRVVVMIYDKALLDEEDILPATFLVFGKSKRPVVKQIGTRWFLSPGSFDQAGLMILEDADEGFVLRVFDPKCKEIRSEKLSVSRAAKMRVAGAPG